MEKERVGWAVARCQGDQQSLDSHCACYLPRVPVASATTVAPWAPDQAKLAESIWQRQLGCSASTWYRGMLPFKGLGSAILQHLNELIPVWIVPLDMHGRGPAYLPTDSDSAGASDPSFLWAASDAALDCDRFYGCYWEPLHRTCASGSAGSSNRTARPRYVHQMLHNSSGGRMERAPYWRARYRSDLEARWGSLAFGAAVLDIWWRPSAPLRAAIATRLREMVSRSGLSHNSDTPGRGWSCVAVHVRRGDACLTPWRRCAPLEEYLAPARHLVRTYGLRRLLLLTDDAAVVSSLVANASREPWAEVLYQRIDRSWMGVTANPHANPKASRSSWVEHRLQAWRDEERAAERCARAKPGGGRHGALPACEKLLAARSPRSANMTPFVDFVTEVEAGSRCSALIGDLLAGLSELLLLRMVARLGRAPPVYSLGDGFCPLSGGPWRCHPPFGAPKKSRSSNATQDDDETATRRWNACARRGSTLRSQATLPER